MSINKLLKLSVFFLIFFCSFKSAPYCKMVDKIISQYSKELRTTEHLKLYGSGGAMFSSVDLVYAQYQTTELLSLARARELYITVMEGYLDRFNANEQIRPYLGNYPFEPKNIDIHLVTKDSSGCLVGDGYVTFVFSNKLENVVEYEGYNFETCSFYTIHKEPYEEALRIVTQDCPK